MVQDAVALVTGVPLNEVHSETRRLGGAFGGDKDAVIVISFHGTLSSWFAISVNFSSIAEHSAVCNLSHSPGKASRSVPIACAAAVAAQKFGREVRLVLDRAEDGKMVGGRPGGIGECYLLVDFVLI